MLLNKNNFTALEPLLAITYELKERTKNKAYLKFKTLVIGKVY